MKKILIIVALLVLVFYGYQKFQNKNQWMSTTSESTTPYSLSTADVDSIAPTYLDTGLDTDLAPPVAPPLAATPSFTCDGRQHCSQMSSCAEATYFIQHCPNTKMDGDQDGIPCEDQLCR